MTTTDMPADPFAQPGDPFDPGEFDESAFADPGGYVEIHDLDGRLLVIFPKRIVTAKSRQNGEQYEKVIADVLVIDGPTTDKMPQIPATLLDQHISAGSVKMAIQGMIGKGKPVLGRVNSQPSQYNRQVKAYGLSDPTDQDKRAAWPALQRYKAEQFG